MNAANRCEEVKSVCWSADESDAVVSNTVPTPEINQKRVYKKYSVKNEAKVKKAVKWLQEVY